MRRTPSDQYLCRASLPRITPSPPKMRIATGEVKTTSSVKCSSRESTSCAFQSLVHRRASRPGQDPWPGPSRDGQAACPACGPSCAPALTAAPSCASRRPRCPPSRSASRSSSCPSPAAAPAPGPPQAQPQAPRSAHPAPPAAPSAALIPARRIAGLSFHGPLPRACPADPGCRHAPGHDGVRSPPCITVPWWTFW
jgi:hypothetical protein